MPRISANVSGLEQYFLHHLAQLDQAMVDSALRVSTGKRINRPADDPAAFLQIGTLEKQRTDIRQARQQVELAANVGAEAQLAVDEVRSQLELVRESLLLDQEGGLTDDERITEQNKIDAAIEALDLAARTEIQGRRLLDGSVNYTFSGRNSSQVRRIDVLRSGETSFSGTVTTAATQAQVTYTGLLGETTSAASLTLTGKRGSTSLEVTSGESLTAVADRINDDSHRTGITASVSGNNLILTSVDYGESAVVQTEVHSGSFNTSGTPQGSDAVVTINGQSIDASAVDGNRVSYTSNNTHVVFELTAGFSGALDTITVSDERVADFLLSPDPRHQTRLALGGVTSDLLGGLSGRVSDLLSGGSLAGLGDNTSQAIRVIDEALTQLTRTEGVVDAFADVTVASASSLLAGLDEELTETLDAINAVDEDYETLLLERQKSLSSNTVSSLAMLQQQQSQVLDLIRLLAGLQ